MKTFIANFITQIKYFTGLRVIWISRIVYVFVSLLTSFTMGMVYKFNEATQNLIGVQNVAIFVLTGFFLQFLMNASSGYTPAAVREMIQNGNLEYSVHCGANIVQQILGIYIASYLFDFVICLPFIVTLSLLTINTISVYALLSFIGFLFISGLCLFSIGFLFSSLYVLSKGFLGFHSVIANIVYFICGVYFPIQGYLTLFGSVGGWIAIAIVSIFPYTYVFDLSRYMIFLGQNYQTFLPFGIELIIFICSSILIMLIAMQLFKLGFKRMRKKGFISFIY
ncbi:MAG: hypothetical protein K9W45_12095 [Candidatus Heimdallarchaeum aukensis]|uniref:Uncharacterized protein n=1 Tax=Candidatus Heimdallarchaeum aukensis TaxID=2876573 RepID=A0A9Y1BK62_9ARCH|nr:MAG: hypothetical protein K9W45_12095 [Candidatus Heimdallarchaeum aukensis]